MAVFTSRPIIFLEENQYSNFEWISETNDGCFLCVWDEEVLVGSSQDADDNVSDAVPSDNPCLATGTHIAVASPDMQTVTVLYTFDKVLPVVQASLNSTRTLLAYVTREVDENSGGSRYCAFVAEVAPQGSVYSLNIDCTRQILLEFLVTEDRGKSSNDSSLSKLLVMIHRESVSIYSFPLRLTLSTEASSGDSCWVLADEPLKEGVCGSFVWAQWNPSQHHLYYLHHRHQSEQSASIALDEEEESEPRVMLTALQFHPSKPHETVLNVPLELAGLDTPSVGGFGSDYRDQGVLHIIGDPWLDLRVVASPMGAVCICHHYIYKSRQAITPADPSSLQVFVAYSVTLLHQGCVVHTVLEQVQWTTAQMATPVYTLMGDHYLAVIIPGVCFHLLDVCTSHPPTNHLLCPPPSLIPPSAQLFSISPPSNLTSGRTLQFVEVDNGEQALELNGGCSSGRIIEMKLTKDSLYQYFTSSNTCLHSKVAVMHMASVHDKDQDLTRKLIWSICNNSRELHASDLLQEYLVAETYATLSRHLHSDVTHLLQLLPMTTHPHLQSDLSANIVSQPGGVGGRVRLSYCPLENATIMLLSPRERVNRPPYSDTWTKLYTVTSRPKMERFPIQHVVEKLMVSLETYKPEVLSQGMTPLSPATPLVGGLTISSLGLTLAHLMFDPLPFNETESTTSSKLEHLLSVSLRELSMYCLKMFPQESPMRLHAVTSKYVCTQLQVSRRLCSMICSSQTIIPSDSSDKGFTFIDQLEPSVLYKLFTLIESYHSATDGVAFPLPQGYTSFFAYLAYRALPQHMFMQYLDRGVLHLNTDVVREIIYDLTPDKLSDGLEITSCVPLMRSLRALNYWPQGSSCSAILTARHHATTILHGEGGQLPPRDTKKITNGSKKDAFPSSSTVSPYQSFVDLLSAKAKLSELDVGLLYEGTVASTKLAGLPITAIVNNQ